MIVEKVQWQRQGGWQVGYNLSSANLILYFGSAEALEASAAPMELSERCPGAVVLGCSTAAGILDGEVDETGLVGVACQFNATGLRLVEADVADAASSADAGRQLGKALRGDGLAGAFILSDGVNVNGSAICAGMSDVLGKTIPVSGGLAADGAQFVHTLVGAGRTARPGRAAALGFYGNAIRLRHATGGGWHPFGPRRRVTRSHGCVLEELDGKPALALYERYLQEEAAGLPGTALFFPLMVWDPQAPERTVVRTVLSIDRDAGTMTFAGDVPQGWGAQLMRGNFDGIVDGAAGAGQRAGKALEKPGACQALALLVSCVGRRLLLGQRVAEELHAVQAAMGSDIRQIGFYSHGEIAPDSATGVAMLHNQTMTITLLSEAP